MKPVDFPQTNVNWGGKDYQDLPAFSNDDETISCWQFSWWERLKLLFSGRIWLRQLNMTAPLQPQLPQLENPFE